MRVAIVLVIMMLTFLGFNHMWMNDVDAQSQPDSPQQGTPGMTGKDAPTVNSEKTVKEDPVCDPTYRPKITKIEPDEFQPGAKVVITGEHFGSKKDCLHEVTFGMEKSKDFTLKGDTTIEATAPDNVAAGLVFVSVVTGGGAAKSAVLIKK